MNRNTALNKAVLPSVNLYYYLLCLLNCLLIQFFDHFLQGIAVESVSLRPFFQRLANGNMTTYTVKPVTGHYLRRLGEIFHYLAKCHIFINFIRHFFVILRIINYLINNKFNLKYCPLLFIRENALNKVVIILQIENIFLQPAASAAMHTACAVCATR